MKLLRMEDGLSSSTPIRGVICGVGTNQLAFFGVKSGKEAGVKYSLDGFKRRTYSSAVSLIIKYWNTYS